MFEAYIQIIAKIIWQKDEMSSFHHKNIIFSAFFILHTDFVKQYYCSDLIFRKSSNEFILLWLCTKSK